MNRNDHQRWTVFRYANLPRSERNKTLNLDKELHKRVVGQDEGVEKVTEAIIRSKAGIKDPTKPIVKKVPTEFENTITVFVLLTQRVIMLILQMIML